jgi:hypothetical protein
MADCDDLKTAMDDLADDLKEAKRNELGHELKTTGAIVTAGTGGSIVLGCLVGLLGGPLGCGAGAYIAATGGLVAGTAVAVGSSIHDDQAEDRREAVERAHNDAKSAYCACLRGDTSDVLPVPVFPPAPPPPDWLQQEQQEEEVNACFSEMEEAQVCEGPDPADQFPPSPDDEIDVGAVCTGEEYGPGF